jgi:cysteinyl-tRNA synthetase
MADLKAGARAGVDENKRNPGDFALWFTKSKFENQALVWDSPWGRGYPGWHIECSAMSIKYLGEQFDIHAGGIDHVPVHHTNEIAQSEGATGKRPWVRYWVHNEFLVLDKGKMAKSAGTFLTLQSLVDQGYDPLDYRYFLLGAHYLSQLNFSWDSLESARNSRKSLMERIRILADQAKLPDGSISFHADSAANITDAAKKRLEAFYTALNDDLSTPRALAEMWGLLRDNAVVPADTLWAVMRMDQVLGLKLESVLLPEKEDEKVIAEIEGLVAERAAAKTAGDFTRADKIRNELAQRGIVLEDSRDGTAWKRKSL